MTTTVAFLLKALAYHLAETFAGRLHERVCEEFCAYAHGENLSKEELIREEYVGIRPTSAYPDCPDYTEKGILWVLLEPAGDSSITLTKSHTMYQTASVSGLYLSHSEARYSGIGMIAWD
jgi:5-methyltetrahydrofolate--homocysteine methyltransferase